jgi:hypothetical protein
MGKYGVNLQQTLDTQGLVTTPPEIFRGSYPGSLPSFLGRQQIRDIRQRCCSRSGRLWTRNDKPRDGRKFRRVRYEPRSHFCLASPYSPPPPGVNRGTPREDGTLSAQARNDGIRRLFARGRDRVEIHCPFGTRWGIVHAFFQLASRTAPPHGPVKPSGCVA